MADQADLRRESPFPDPSTLREHPRMQGAPSGSINDAEYERTAEKLGGVNDDRQNTHAGYPVPVMDYQDKTPMERVIDGVERDHNARVAAGAPEHRDVEPEVVAHDVAAPSREETHAANSKEPSPLVPEPKA